MTYKDNCYNEKLKTSESIHYSLVFRKTFFIIFDPCIYYLIFYNMKRGKVKFFLESKGYGFIVDDETDTDYFVHVSGLIDEIKENDEVTFEVKEGRKGLNAVDVRLA